MTNFIIFLVFKDPKEREGSAEGPKNDATDWERDPGHSY
jgi:hypothetical protein